MDEVKLCFTSIQLHRKATVFLDPNLLADNKHVVICGKEQNSTTAPAR